MSGALVSLFSLWVAVAVVAVFIAAAASGDENWRAWWFIAAVMWPLTLLTFASHAVYRDLFSEESRLQRRIAAAERARTLTEMRRIAERAEAEARRTFEAYIESETP